MHEKTLQPSLGSVSSDCGFLGMRQQQSSAPVSYGQSGKHHGSGRSGAIYRDRSIQFHANIGVSGIGELVAESADYRPAQQHVWSWAYHPAIHGTMFRLYRDDHYDYRARTSGCQKFKPLHLIYDIYAFGASTYNYPGKRICGSNGDNELPLVQLENEGLELIRPWRRPLRVIRQIAIFRKQEIRPALSPSWYFVFFVVKIGK